MAGEDDFLHQVRALRVGRRAPNPLYAHLFAAFELDRRRPELGLPDLDVQLGRWLPWASALEHRGIHFGLSPYGTALRYRENVRDHLARGPLPAAENWSAVRLRDDAARLRQVRAFAASRGTPRREFDDGQVRELWHLLFGHDDLFLTLLPA